MIPQLGNCLKYTYPLDSPHLVDDAMILFLLTFPKVATFMLYAMYAMYDIYPCSKQLTW